MSMVERGKLNYKQWRRLSCTFVKKADRVVQFCEVVKLASEQCFF